MAIAHLYTTARWYPEHPKIFRLPSLIFMDVVCIKISFTKSPLSKFWRYSQVYPFKSLAGCRYPAEPGPRPPGSPFRYPTVPKFPTTCVASQRLPIDLSILCPCNKGHKQVTRTMSSRTLSTVLLQSNIRPRFQLIATRITTHLIIYGRQPRPLGLFLSVRTRLSQSTISCIAFIDRLTLVFWPINAL